MLEIKGQYCKDIKIFTDNIEEEVLSTIFSGKFYGKRSAERRKKKK